MNKDLDVEVAEVCFGWRLIKVPKSSDRPYDLKILFPPDREPDQDFYSMLPLRGLIHKGWYTPKWSGDMTEAIKLCIKVKLPVMVCDIPLDPEQLTRMALEHFKKSSIKKPSVHLVGGRILTSADLEELNRREQETRKQS